MYDPAAILILAISAIPLAAVLLMALALRFYDAGKAEGFKEGLAEKKAHNRKAYKAGHGDGYMVGWKAACEMAAEARLDLWIVGEAVACPRCVDGWLFAGVFRTEAEAVAACHSRDYFVAPAILGEVLPPELQDWPGLYYPHDEVAEEAARRTADVDAFDEGYAYGLRDGKAATEPGVKPVNTWKVNHAQAADFQTLLTATNLGRGCCHPPLTRPDED